MRYGGTNASDGERVVHNFPPRSGQAFGDDGFRYWTESAAEDGRRDRCHCHWTAVAPEHYSTRHAVAERRAR